MTVLIIGPEIRQSILSALGEVAGTKGDKVELYAGEIDDLAAHIRKRSDVTLVVFNEYLAQFKTDENIRYFASVAATATKDGCLVVGDANRRLDEVLTRAALGLDLSMTKTQVEGLDVHHIVKRDGLTTMNAPSLSLTASWFGDRNGRLASANEILAAAMMAHFERRGMSLIRIGHCETRMLGYGPYFSRQDLQKTVHIQWGDDPIDEDAFLSLPAEMLSAVKDADFIGLQPPNTEIVSKNSILENASYVVARDLGAYQLGARFANANVHLMMGKSPLLFELIREAQKVWLITGRDIASRLAKNIGRDVHAMLIPAERKFSDGAPIEPHFTTVFERVKDQIGTDVQPGDVVLVGAGILGKIYCSLAKGRGAVALDIGSVFDAWAGLNTRGSGFSIAPLSE